MLEIFIPTLIKKQKIEINKISKNFLVVLEKFKIEDNIIIEKFDSKFFEGIKIFSKKINKNLIILCNWEFWKYYFLDYDRIENKNIISFGNSIWKIKNLEKDLWKIQTNIEEIINFLNSKKLLTNSKKEEIKNKIQDIFFSLSGIAYILYENKKKLEENRENLKNYNWLEEYKAQASLILQTTKTTKLEIETSLQKFENILELYLDSLKKIFL